MSDGTKKQQSPSQSKPKVPAGLLEEYEAMVKLANEAEKRRGQKDTYWHTTRDRIKAALRDEYGMEV